MEAEDSVDRSALILAHVNTAIGDVDPFDHQHLGVELDLTTCMTHQTGGIDPPSRERPGERPGESTGGSPDDVIESGRVRRELALRDAVMLGHRPVHAVHDRVALPRKVSLPHRAFTALDHHL